MADSTLAVLGYHKVGAAPHDAWWTWNHVPVDTFRQHLSLVADLGWDVVNVAGLRAALAGETTLPRKALLITFDDGYHVVWKDALPGLKEFDHGAIAFIPTAYVGDMNRWDEGVQPTESICGWAELRDLEEGGVSIQSHGVSHRGFSSLDDATIQEELVNSRARLEVELGKRVDFLAFPYGDSGRDVASMRRALAAAGYSGAFLYPGGLNTTPLSDPFQIRRLAVGPDTDLAALLSS